MRPLLPARSRGPHRSNRRPGPQGGSRPGAFADRGAPGTSRALWYHRITMRGARLSTFEDWIEYFRKWQEAIDLGDYEGERRWETVLEVPDQRIRDALLHLITYQGDTEFGSVEQQRHLAATAPSSTDLEALVRIMREEMRHGWQMA